MKNLKHLQINSRPFHNNKFISNSRDKADFFNIFFARQCTLIDKASEIPPRLNIKTTKILSLILVTKANIAKIITNLDPNKAYGHDMISTRKLKLYGDSVLPFLELIFKSVLKVVPFPPNGKCKYSSGAHKKGDKQSLKNYQPIQLLPICGKILEQLIYNKMFEYFIESDLISHNQSGFKPGDSCINQLLSITHEIYKSFDEGYETRAIFLDVLKASDKVWHKGLLHKLKENSISGK